MKAPEESVCQSSPDRRIPLARGEEDGPEEDGSGVHMACLYQSGNIGVACYDTTTAEVTLAAHTFVPQDDAMPVSLRCRMRSHNAVSPCISHALHHQAAMPPLLMWACAARRA